MKATIEVKNRDEALAVKTAMDDPTTRALVLVVGTLLQLPTDRARRRVLAAVYDHLEEQAGRREEAVREP